MDKFDAVVVGAGHQGLVAAARLVDAGPPTLVTAACRRSASVCECIHSVKGELRS